MFFRKMYSFFVIVVFVAPKRIVVLEKNSFENKYKIFKSKNAFKEAYSYKSIPDYWVYYCRNDLKYIDAILEKIIRHDGDSKEEMIGKNMITFVENLKNKVNS